MNLIAIGDCDVCGKKNIKLHWTRAYPALQMCRECFLNAPAAPAAPEEGTRLMIARMLRRIRREDGRAAAILTYDNLRGTGVPINPRRNRRKQ